MNIKQVYLLLLLLVGAAYCPLAAGKAPVGPAVDVGIDEHLGAIIPLDTKFKNEDGKTVTLRQVITKPTILSLVYFECPGICTPLLTGLASTIRDLDLHPGQDYNVLSVSFNEKDTADIAKGKKANYLTLIQDPFPPDAWHFLTGSRDAIQKLTDAVGFKFVRKGKDFLHPASIFFIAPDGRIIRYMYGTDYLPFDVKMALTEASRGQPGPTINKVLLYCYSYDPIGRRYVTNFTRVAGVLTIVGVSAVLAILGAKIKRGKAGLNEARSREDS